MKKSYVFSFALMSGLLLAACGNGDAGDEEATADQNGENGNGEDGEAYELQFGMQPGTQSNEYEAAEYLADYVEEESDGQMTITLYPDAQLGDDLSMLGQLQDGSLDITFAEIGRFGEWVPRAELLMVPYVIEDFDHIERVIYDTEYGDELRQELVDEHSFRVMDTGYNGTRQTSTNTEINELADMEGLSIRTPEAQTLLDYAEYTGANPTPMNFDEVYLALQTNQVDGQENPLSAIEAQSFYEVQDYIAMTNHVVNDNTYVVSDVTWLELPEDLQQILSDGITEATEHHTELFVTEEEELLEFFEEEGVTITEPDLEEFEEAVSEVYPEYLDKIGEGAEEYMDIIDEARE
ncbi:DctP family TRAP transporter solute-binding subunit [Salicibibacter halophilus]|uniref:DctP family TRAP transporter solute-binding subunit n=1 Tax=Salicibibacter halophilus TaxID=2502791 RepID=A0A514LM29_9BACI|nr:DctP family TRAP transporter solute-binding subunit [Salicibibacter halophilus]QDI92311.1 DctP family TRAP transporter solute-binding subunit [Salicibibacter halophilus]